ncbi:MAG: prepilin-type N-terminal cleavage/methylation domain-containing protein [Proteocatella sp.]
MKNLRKNKKGFTLVEIIVVLVIIAVLAAAAIPTMIGFVEDSKGKAEIANARAAYIACQAIATEEYAVDGSVEFGTGAYTIGGTAPSGKDDIQKKLDQMLKVDLNSAKVTVTEANGKVSKVVYSSVAKNSKYYEVTIEDGKAAKVEKKGTSSSSNGNNGNGNGQS